MIAARLPDGSLARFPTPEAFGHWLTSSRPRGLVQVLNGSPGSCAGGRDTTPSRPPADRPGVHGTNADKSSGASGTIHLLRGGKQ